MAANKYILSLDQGTTSSRALLIDKTGTVVAVAQEEFRQIFPKPGWVEHDADEIWQSQLKVAQKVIKSATSNSIEIAAIGITNQRETTILWDRETGNPIYNAIVWQDRRTSDSCSILKAEGFSSMIRNKTGLVIDAYFSATKIKWLLDHIPGARALAEKGHLAFGTVDSWLIWKLTSGRVHATDVSNASRTMLFNIQTLSWDEELLELFTIPRSILPVVKSSSMIYGECESTLFNAALPISGVAGDQQAALFGQLCTQKGMIKNTYGTGCFLMMNTGDKPVFSQNNLLTTVGWQLDGKITYALEGSVFIAGAAIQWLRDGLNIISDSKEIEALAESVSDNGGVYFVPAFAGLGAPHWDQQARGTISGLTRGVTRGHIARAALESIAYQTHDVLQAMILDSGINPVELRVDGGAAINRLLMQFQADILNLRIIRPKSLESTAMGAAYLAGLAVGFWTDLNQLQQLWRVNAQFLPNHDKTITGKLLHNWQQAVKRSGNWMSDIL